MSSIEQKLRENRHRRERESLLSTLPQLFSEFLQNVEYSSDVDCIRYAAFSTWDHERDCLTTTRGVIDNWNNYTFKCWEELITSFKSLPVNECTGWLFFDTEGPYFKIKLSDLQYFLNDVETYTRKFDLFDFGWVGADIDCGAIAEFNHTSFCRNEFELSVWGI